jgi:hypothetical protein
MSDLEEFLEEILGGSGIMGLLPSGLVSGRGVGRRACLLRSGPWERGL